MLRSRFHHLTLSNAPVAHPTRGFLALSPSPVFDWHISVKFPEVSKMSPLVSLVTLVDVAISQISQKTPFLSPQQPPRHITLYCRRERNSKCDERDGWGNGGASLDSKLDLHCSGSDCLRRIHLVPPSTSNCYKWRTRLACKTCACACGKHVPVAITWWYAPLHF